MIGYARRLLSLVVLVVLFLSVASLMSLSSSTPVIVQGSVVTAMRQMADWQINALGNSQAEGWDTATFFDGLMALYQTTNDSKYLDRAVSWGMANHWTPASSQFNPDNQNAGQAFLEMYLIQHSANQLTPTENAIDAVMLQNGTATGQPVWWWEDSLFMAPPTFSRLGGVTGNASYLNFMDGWYWEAANYLLDPTTNLLWRDARFFGKTCLNGQKMFWSRGNAWVISGIVRVLEFLPANYPDRPRFVSLLQNMAAAILPLQRSDGYWSSCLTDTTDYPEPETSGTAGFVYALAWAINNGILDPNTYAPVVQSGWNAIVNAIQPSGALGWVQPTGDQPGPSTASDSFTYGTGLALLAGSEVAKINDITTTSSISSSTTISSTTTRTTAPAVTMTVSYSVAGGGNPTPPVLRYVLKGVSKTLTLTKTAKAVTVDSGSAWSVTSNPLGGSSSSQQWYSSQPLTGTASATTVVFAFQHQYYLTMKVSGPGSVTPSNGWRNASQKVTIKATPNVGHKFKSWMGTGMGGFTGTTATATVTLNSAITETANFS